VVRIESVTFRTSAADLQGCPNTPLPEIAVSGRSNVGKSSLLNALCKRRGLAKVSSTPGKTQLLNFFLVNERFHLVDLPGYGYARVPGNVQRNWQTMMQSYLQHRDALVGVIQLLDCRHAPTQQDRQMVQWLLEVGLPFCLILTKIDKLKQGQRGRVARSLVQTLSEDVELPDDLPVLQASSKTGEGQVDLLRWIDWVLSQKAQ
jgi:GTP-binding protein